MCYRKRARGFIESRTLLAVFVILSILPLLIMVFRFCADFDFDYDRTSGELALIDLRRVLLLAYDTEVYDDEIDFIYHGDNYHLRLVNNKLLLQPGSQMYLNNIVDLHFFKKNGCIYMSYVTSKGKEYERNIGKEEGIYLNDFLDNNDELPNFDNDDF